MCYYQLSYFPFKHLVVLHSTITKQRRGTLTLGDLPDLCCYCSFLWGKKNKNQFFKMDILELLLPYLENKDKIKMCFNKQIVERRNESFLLFPKMITYQIGVPRFIWDCITMIDFSLITLKELPILPKHLTHLRCNYNYITSLPELPQLVELNVSHNCLLELPKLPSSLKKLYCAHNFLKKLPELPKNLELLSIFENDLREQILLPTDIKLVLCSADQQERFQFTCFILVM